MKKYEPLPVGEVEKWTILFKDKPLGEIVGMLGPPAREHPASPRLGVSPDGSVIEKGQYVKTLEYVGVSPSVKTLLIKVRDDGALDFEFRGRESEGSK